MRQGAESATIVPRLLSPRVIDFSLPVIENGDSFVLTETGWQSQAILFIWGGVFSSVGAALAIWAQSQGIGFRTYCILWIGATLGAALCASAAYLSWLVRREVTVRERSVEVVLVCWPRTTRRVLDREEVYLQYHQVGYIAGERQEIVDVGYALVLYLDDCAVCLAVHSSEAAIQDYHRGCKLRELPTRGWGSKILTPRFPRFAVKL